MTDNEVFAGAGRTLAQAHRFERNLKGFAALVHRIHTAGDSEPDETSFSKLSIGPLIDAARRLIRIDPGAEALLERARVRRNEIAHSFFEDHDEELKVQEGRERLVSLLHQDGALFARAANLCSERMADLLEALEKALREADGG